MAVPTALLSDSKKYPFSTVVFDPVLELMKLT
jgi:hypothetical protein